MSNFALSKSEIKAMNKKKFKVIVQKTLKILKLNWSFQSKIHLKSNSYKWKEENHKSMSNKNY